MQFLKQLISRMFPEFYQMLRRRFSPYERAATAIKKRFGTDVMSGPFAGMLYLDYAVNSVYTPKVLGCYELEIAPIIERIIKSSYSVIVDVGCAEGYYAVGLAICCPKAHIYAFDAGLEARQACQQLSEINGVSARVTIEGFCDADALKSLPLVGGFLLCDIEGDEETLLDPVKLPELLGMDILVELHELFRPGVTALILSRFQHTHGITLIDALDRNPADFPAIHFLSAVLQRVALSEKRPPGHGQQYAFLEKKRK